MALLGMVLKLTYIIWRFLIQFCYIGVCSSFKLSFTPGTRPRLWNSIVSNVQFLGIKTYPTLKFNVIYTYLYEFG